MTTNRAAVDPVGTVDSYLARLGIIESDCITFAIRGDDAALRKRRQDAANLRQEIFELVREVAGYRTDAARLAFGSYARRVARDKIRADLAREPYRDERHPLDAERGR